MSVERNGFCAHEVVRYLEGKDVDAASHIILPRSDGGRHVEQSDNNPAKLIVKCGMIGCSTECVLIDAHYKLNDRGPRLVFAELDPRNMLDICADHSAQNVTALE